MGADLDAQKTRLRTLAKRSRAEAARQRPRANEQVTERVKALLSRPSILSGYWPLPHEPELDPRPLMHWFHEQGGVLALPAVPRTRAPLVFREWAPDTRLVQGRFGVLEPPQSAPPCLPRVVLVPLLAFDREGHRLGYGGGFYDRTLQMLRAQTEIWAMGLAYANQELDAVPRGPYDEPLDFIATEDELIELSS